ncbi:MAG: ATP-dependent Clp protease ATP-binding subunit ClpX [Acidaminococcaceae bacterium]|nr:ATP-dependent Clp protease ATP-binding subunit ClpX [Acidaminococcaceae bacterium]
MTKHRCSFCGKPENEKNVLVGSEDWGGYICENCWQAVGRALDHETFGRSGNSRPAEVPAIDCDKLDPESIKEYLDRHIIGQDKAKKVLSVAVYNHYKMLDYAAKHADKKGKVTLEKSNILMVGPTGVGKTAIIKALADVLHVPFAITDATTMTENGYVGADPESCIQRLLRAAGGDVAKAETGIVYIDEIDKIACKGENLSITRDVSGEGVQQALLKIIEGTHVDLQPEGSRRHPNSDTVDIDTSRILFIVGGAFMDLEYFIRERIDVNPDDARPLGFCAERKQEKNTDLSYNEIIDRVTQEDMRNYGIIPELLGRLPVIVPLHELGSKELCRILTEPQNSLVKQYQEIFRCDDVELRFTDGALQAIADKAIRNGTGARGLRSIMESVLLDKMFTIKRNAKGQQLLLTKRDINKAFAITEQPAALVG